MSAMSASKSWLARFGVLICALVAMLALIEILLRSSFVSERIVRDVVDIQSPATLAAKVRHFAGKTGTRIVLLGDSLAAGMVMREHGDKNWRKNTISADLERRISENRPGYVLNLGMNGLLPADMETVVDAILPTRPDAVIINISLRSFSMDFAAPDQINSRSWLKPGMSFTDKGRVRRLPDQFGPSNAAERLLLNNWATYRLRDLVRARFLGGEPRDSLKSLRSWVETRGRSAAADAAEMRLLMQVKSRYSSVTLDSSNPQFVAWSRMLGKLKAAKQKVVVFYATENPRLLGGLIDQGAYTRLTEDLRLSVASFGAPISYLPPNPGLKDEMFLDHVHVNGAGNQIYGSALFSELVSDEIFARKIGPVLDLSFLGFIEKLDSAAVELGRITDFSSSTATASRPDRPRINLQDYSVIAVERRGAEPLRDIMHLYYWWTKEGVPLNNRDSYHMLRASVVGFDSYPEDLRALLGGSPPKEYVDVFAGIPVLRGAAQTAFYLQDSGMRSGSKAATGALVVYGNKIERQVLAKGALNVQRKLLAGQNASVPDVSFDLDFGRSSGRNLTGQGVRFEIDRVATVYALRANHDLFEVSSGDVLLGAMTPQTFAYRTQDGQTRTIAVSGADILTLNYDKTASRLVVDVSAYDFRERTTRASMSFPGSDGRRVHPNLGIVSALPPQKLKITHSNSATLAFATWQPQGALASLAVTEHADFVGAAQDVVTMYGDTEKKVTDGRGFLGNRIPLTKTIFPAGQPNPFKSRTASTETVGDFRQDTAEAGGELLDMLRSYRRDGFDVEIGIHCVGTATQVALRRTSNVAEALRKVAEFNPVTWVDHGGRDCLWEAGWDPSSPNYIVPVLREHGFRYVNMLGDKYDGRISMIADNQPSNLLFYSVGLDDNLDDNWKPYAFTTVPVGFGRDQFTKAHIAEIIRARGLVNVHTYLPYEATKFERAADGGVKLVPNPWYNELLANVASARASGDLHTATTANLNDYILKMRTLHVWADARSIHVENPEAYTVPGVTIGQRAIVDKAQQTAALAGVKTAGHRERDGAHYLWFDLVP